MRPFLSTLAILAWAVNCTVLDPPPSSCIDEIREYSLISKELLNTYVICRNDILKEECVPENFKVGTSEIRRLWNSYRTCEELGYVPQ